MAEPIPTEWKRQRRFERDAKPHYVYELFDRSGQALYVGVTSDLPARIRSHSSKPWWPHVHDMQVRRHEDRVAGIKAELDRIHDLQPLYNVQATEWGNERVREVRNRRAV